MADKNTADRTPEEWASYLVSCGSTYLALNLTNQILAQGRREGRLEGAEVMKGKCKREIELLRTYSEAAKNVQLGSLHMIEQLDPAAVVAGMDKT